MFYSPSSYLSISQQPGVYVFFDNTNTPLYVGKAKNLKSRVSSYFVNTNQLGEKTRVLVSQIKRIRTTVVESELEALLLESYYIKKFLPKYNIKLTDNKSYVLVRITRKETFPAIVLDRRQDDPKSIYFGPYPSSRAVKLVLRTIRRAFPFHSTLNHPKKICLYNHLGLCPCLPATNNDMLKKEYQKSIKTITRIFEGKSRTVLHELEKHRDKESAKENYEKAAELQRKINALSYITTPSHNPIEYELNPNLREDIRYKELAQLQEVLKPYYPDMRLPIRIECFDISNTQGTNATASMVVAQNGEKASKFYRKFKIRRENTPNDFAMMKEVIQRRLKHTEWDYPDLLIVDGGKGQVSSAKEVLDQNNSILPLIGLAKREETIVIPVRSKTGENSFQEILLPKNSGALQLLQRIRNESHRFAITYHKLLRSKAMTS